MNLGTVTDARAKLQAICSTANEKAFSIGLQKLERAENLSQAVNIALYQQEGMQGVRTNQLATM